MVEELWHYQQAKNLDIWGVRGFRPGELEIVEKEVEDILYLLGFVPADKGRLGRIPH